MKLIELTMGKFAQVDDEMFDYLDQWSWRAQKAHKTYYAVGFTKGSAKDRSFQCMHHLVIGITCLPMKLGLTTDHKDGNGLNNKRNNLRIVTYTTNNQNKTMHRNGKLPGTYLMKGKLSKPWQAHIVVNHKKKNLGYFGTEQEAHQAYLKALENVS